MVYELDFQIGNTKCLLVNVQPFNVPSERVGKYYEHCHPCFELHYIERGEATFLCNKKAVTVSEDHILIIPPRMYHKEISSDEDTSKMTISIDLSPRSPTADDHFYNVFQKDKVISIAASASLAEGMLRIKRLAAARDVTHTSREKLRACVHLLMAELYDELSNTAPSENSIQNDSTLSREYEIDTYIALNFTKSSSRDDLANKLHVSPRQLHRIMMKSYGMGYRKKLLEIRLEIAISFLTSTDKSITAISEEMGYSSVESFSAFIKRETGKSPREIRAAANNKK